MLVVIAGLVLMHWRRRVGMIVAATALALLLILSLPIVGQALLVSLETGLPLHPSASDPPRAIVILSAELERTRGPGPRFQIGPLTLQRLRAGADLQRRTHLPVLVSGGRLKANQPPIAELMAASLQQDFGIRAQWIEGRSHNTWENAGDSAAILAPLGIRSVYLVTHAWHEHRAILAFRRVDLRPTAAPVQLDALADGVLPQARAWMCSYYALHEWIGLAWYWLVDHIWPSNSAA